MAQTIRIFAAVALLSMSAALATSTMAQDSGLKTLRDTPLNQVDTAPDIYKQSTPGEGFGHAYRQQPPLIPHKIDGYQVSTSNNACMNCHDWPGHIEAKAPKVSETHYVDREGVRLDKVAGTRYFCQQCHVPQVDAKPLVNNTFQNATQAK